MRLSEDSVGKFVLPLLLFACMMTLFVIASSAVIWFNYYGELLLTFAIILLQRIRIFYWKCFEANLKYFAVDCYIGDITAWNWCWGCLTLKELGTFYIGIESDCLRARISFWAIIFGKSSNRCQWTKEASDRLDWKEIADTRLRKGNALNLGRVRLVGWSSFQADF